MKNEKSRPPIPLNGTHLSSRFKKIESKDLEDFNIVDLSNEPDLPAVLLDEDANNHNDFTIVHEFSNKLIEHWSIQNSEKSLPDVDLIFHIGQLMTLKGVLVDQLVVQTINNSIKQIDDLGLRVSHSMSIDFYGFLLETIVEYRQAIKNLIPFELDLLSVPNSQALQKLKLLEQVMTHQFANRKTFEPVFQSDIKFSQLVELADALFYTGIITGKKQLEIYRSLGRIFGKFTNDESFKNTHVNNKNRERDKSLFLSSLVKGYEKGIAQK